MIVLRRIDNSCNMARFYTLSIERSLFGESILIRRWGRIGTCGRTSIETWPSEGEAEDAARRTLRQKSRRGYRPAER